MSSGTVIKNKSNNKEYFASIVSVHKQIQVPIETELNNINRERPEPTEFDNIIFEAAVYLEPVTNLLAKPFLVVELDDGYTKKITKDKFTKLVIDLVKNKKIDDFKNLDLSSYDKYGFLMIKHTMFQLSHLNKINFIFIIRTRNSISF